MRFGLKPMLTIAAIAAFSTGLLVPIAAAGGTGTMMGGGPGATDPVTQTNPGAMMGGTDDPGTQPGTGTMMGGTSPGATDPGTQVDPGTMMGGTTDPGTTPGAGTMMGGGTTPGAAAPGAMMGGTWDGTGPWGGTGMWGMMGSGMAWLRDDPAAMQAWLQLRTEHQQEMQTWYQTYKADLTSPAAQQALHDLWTEHWNDMQSFRGQYASGSDWTVPAMGMWNGWQMGDMMDGGTWDASHMWGSGYGASWMVGHPAGMGQWLSLRGRQLTGMHTWMQRYGSAPGSAAAQAALTSLTAQHRTQVKHFFRRHHLSTGPAMMHAATGGWMGLGGMWGGFGW